MALDYSKLSDDELDAIANDDYSRLSDSTLRAITRDPAAKAAPEQGAEVIANLAAPAVTAAGMPATGVGQLTRDAAQAARPLAQSVVGGFGNVAQTYKAYPIAAPVIDAIGMGTIGIPPIAASQGAMGAYDKFKAVEAGKNIGSQILSQGAPATTPVQGLPTTATKGPYMDMLRAAGPEVGAEISRAYGAQTGGAGNNAVRSWLNSTAGQQAMAANPELAQRAAQYLEAVPSYAQQAGRIAGPVLRGAARVAGPVGMAANLYEAAPYLEQAGPELSSGRAQGRIAQAQQQMLNQPTPAPLSPIEASNLLSSNDERTINIYGGRQRLEEIVKSAVRQSAASRVLAPIKPGSF